MTDIRTLAEEAAEMLRQMVAIPSHSFEEEKVCGFMESSLREYGLKTVKVKNNLIVTGCSFDPGKETLMLCAHTDTVSPVGGYAADPYDPDYAAVEKLLGTDRNEVVYGLGSNDDGGSVVSMCAVMRYYRQRKLPVNLIAVFSSEEERSGKNGMDFIWRHFNEIPGFETAGRPVLAIVGEPTGMKAATSERGLLVIDAEAKGESGHAARDEGKNAIYIAMEDILKIKNHDFDRISPAMGKVRLNVTQISAGETHNVIPGTCSFVIDIRPTEMYDNKEITETLQSMCNSRLIPRNLENKASATRPDSPLLECVSALGIETYSSPTTSDWMRIGCDAVKIGPGDSARSHRKDEYVTKKELQEAIDIYIKLIDKYIQSR